MRKLFGLGIAVCFLIAGLAFFWMKGVVRDPASGSSASLSSTARPDAELAQPAGDETELAPPEHEQPRVANAVSEEQPIAASDALGTKAPFSIRALCLDEAGDALEGVALTVVSLADCPIAYSDSTGLVQLEFERDLERVGQPILAMKSAGAPIAIQLSKASRATRVLYGPALEELEFHDCGRVELPPAGVVVGRVLGTDGLPIVGAKVLPASPISDLRDEEERNLRVSGLFWLSVEFGALGATTDFDGRFRIDGMSTKPACVWTQHEGTYATWSEPLQLAADSTLDVGTLTLQPLASEDRIGGQVLKVDGSPSASAMVSCAYSTDTAMGPSAYAMADQDGRFQIAALAGVTHILLAYHPEEASRIARQDEVLGGAQDVLLRFEASVQTGPPSSLVKGRVFLAGEPAPFAPLESFLYRDASGIPIAWREHRADSEGRFVLELPLGLMRLRARSADGTAVGMSAEYEVIAPGDSAVVAPESEQVATIGGFVLESGESEVGHIPAHTSDPAAQELVIDLEPVASIEGKILAPSGVELSGIEFRASGPNGLSHKTSTGSDGSFRFERLLPGSWTVKRISTPLFTRGDNTPEGAESREIMLGVGTSARLEFDLRGSGQFEGRIAIEDQSYSAWHWRIAGEQGKLDSDGRFRVRAIQKLGESWIAAVRQLAHSMIQVTHQVRLEPGLNQWSFEVEAGSVELRGLPLDSEFPFEGQFEPPCCLYYEHSDGVVWEAMPITAKGGTLLIENVPCGRVLVVSGGLGAVLERTYSPNSPVGEILAELNVVAGETATFEWRD